MQSKFSGNLSQKKNAARVFFVFGLLVSLICGLHNPTASAALGDSIDFRIALEGQSKDLSARLNALSSSDYTASYSQNFYSTAEKNAANTTGNWSASSGFLSLSPAASATSAPSYTVEDRSSSLSGFTGPVSMFANNNTVPLIGSKAGSLNLPISTVSNETMISFSDRLLGFASFDIKALGFSACGNLDTYETTAGSDGQILLGNEQTHVYFLVAGDNADKSVSTKAVKINKIRLVSLSSDGKISTQTEDVSSGLTSLGFEAITDVSCSDTECLIAGTKGKLARYDGKIYTDLSGKLGSTAGNLTLAVSEDGYFLIAGSEPSSVSGRYVGRISKYQSGTISKISEDSFFVSTAAGTFGMAFDHYSDECLIVRGAENVAAYVYGDGKFEDVSSKINKYYTSGSMNPVIYGGRPGVWFIIDKGTTGSIVRFDGESAIDIRDSLDINISVSVIGSNGSGSAILIGGGTASSPKLYKVTESSSYASTNYQLEGVVESLKVNKTTGTITSAYLLASDYIPTGTSLKYYLSADGGVHWEEAIIGTNDTSSKVTFHNPGTDLRWKVSMATTDAKRSPSVYGLHIYYTEGSSLITTLQNGELIRASNGAKVYIIMDGKKRWIASAAEFSKMGYSWAKVKIVSPDALDDLAEIKLIKAKGGSSIFYITGSGMKKLVLNDAVFKSYGNKYEDVVEIDQAVLDSYPTVRFIKGADGRVYQITGAVKKWIKNPEEFQRLGGVWTQVAPVNDVELAAYEEVGVTVAANAIVDGDLIRTIGNPDVYIVKIVGAKKFKRLVLSPKVFKSYGHLKWENIKEVTSDVANGFGTSELVATCAGKARADADCDIYVLQSSGDNGSRLILSKADFLAGKYDIDSVYVINSTDFGSYSDKLYGSFESSDEAVIQAQIFFRMFDLLVWRYGADHSINKQKFLSIMEKVIIREEDQAATQLRGDFQELLMEEDSGNRPVIAASLKSLMQDGLLMEKYILQDAITSIDAKQLVRSAERKAMEDKIIEVHFGMVKDLPLIDELIMKVVNGQPINIYGKDLYYSRQNIADFLSGMDSNLSGRINQLF